MPVLGRATFRGLPVTWTETIVYHLLTSRSVIGEYQPCRGRGSDREPDGDPVANYYPAAVDDKTFYAVEAALRSRVEAARGRRGQHVNPFAGLFRDARDGGAFTYKA